jgi:hypothetical protein
VRTAAVPVSRRNPDGRILLGGAFTEVNGHAQTNLVRLNLDGSVDISFAGQWPGPVVQILMQDDGEFVIMDGSGRAGGSGAGPGWGARLRSDGSIEALFPYPQIPGCFFAFVFEIKTVLGDGSMYASLGSYRECLPLPLIRLNSEGNLYYVLDANFGREFGR